MKKEIDYGHLTRPDALVQAAARVKDIARHRGRYDEIDGILDPYMWDKFKMLAFAMFYCKNRDRKSCHNEGLFKALNDFQETVRQEEERFPLNVIRGQVMPVTTTGDAHIFTCRYLRAVTTTKNCLAEILRRETSKEVQDAGHSLLKLSQQLFRHLDTRHEKQNDILVKRKTEKFIAERITDPITPLTKQKIDPRYPF